MGFRVAHESNLQEIKRHRRRYDLDVPNWQQGT